VYNSVNGEPGCANSFLLQDQLRDKWKFQGYVVSDCDAVADIQRGHHFVNTLAEAGAISIKRGTDLDCNDTGIDYSRYVAAVQQGLLTEAELDVAVKRLMKARMQLGMFDPPELVKYSQIPYSEMDTPEHRELSLRLARESMVLLKNDGLLPLKPGAKKIAVVGPLADQLPVLYGNYNGVPSRATSALQGIQKQFGSSEITYSAGTRFLRLGQIISDAILSTPDGQPGLKADYFKGINLEGAPVLSRVDKAVDFTFAAPDAIPTVGNMNFSARWTGFLTPLESGTFDLGFNGDDGYRVWMDDKLLLEDWSMHGASLKTTPVTLEKGHKYAIKIEYFQAAGGAVAQFVWYPPTVDPLQKALADAGNADVVIAVVGITSALEGEEMGINLPGFKGGDRTSLDLPQEEEDMLKTIKATGKPLVVVLMNGSALAVNWAQANANAILDAWYPGEEGGTAIAETLAGANNPAGRLPVTFYTGIDQLPAFEDYAMNNRTYRYFKGQPLYPFGYGLSYSKFAYSKAKLSKAKLKAGEPLTVEAMVKNTGGHDGDEVVQVYLAFPQLPGAPIRALRGFTRVRVAAGKTQLVQLKLDPRDLSYVNEAGDRLVAAGKYRVSVGGGQPGTSAAAVEVPLEISGEYKLPE
jgi:beta-glucosidase